MLVLVGILITGYLLNRAYIRLLEASSVRDRIDSTKKWIKVNARIIGLGINVDHDYPQLVPDVSHIKEQEELDVFINKQEQLFYRRNYNTANYKGLLIKYTYSYKGNQYTSRNIGVLFDQKDIQRVNNYQYGDKVAARINPDKPTESIIRPTGEELYTSFVNKILFSSIKDVIIITATWGLILSALI